MRASHGQHQTQERIASPSTTTAQTSQRRAGTHGQDVRDAKG